MYEVIMHFVESSVHRLKTINGNFPLREMLTKLEVDDILTSSNGNLHSTNLYAAFISAIGHPHHWIYTDEFIPVTSNFY